MKKLLLSEKLINRFLSLYGIGLVLLLIAWTIAYHFFPEGALRGSSAASRLAGEEVSSSLTAEFFRIFSVNLLFGGLIYAFNFAIKINRFPLGYMIPLVWFLLYGLILGTDSFTFGLPERTGPSFSVLQRSGIYELAAYTLFAVSTFHISRFEIKQLFKTNPEKIETPEKTSSKHYPGILIAVLILILANLREALMVTHIHP